MINKMVTQRNNRLPGIAQSFDGAVDAADARRERAVEPARNSARATIESYKDVLWASEREVVGAQIDGDLAFEQRI